MSMLLMDGFDYLTGNLTNDDLILTRRNWIGYNGMSATTGVFGGYALSISDSTSAGTRKYIGAEVTTIFLHVRTRYNSNSSGNHINFGSMIPGSANQLCGVELEENGYVRVKQFTSTGNSAFGAYNEIGLSAPQCFVADTWFTLEIKATIADVGGTFEVRIDGKTIISLVDVRTTNQNESVWKTVNSINFHTTHGNNFYDDLAIWDDSGSSCNDWMGTNRIRTQFAVADGDNIDSIIGGTAPAATHWQSVNNKLIGTAQYVYIPYTAPGDFDLYDMTPNVDAPFVWALQTTIVAYQDDATQLIMRTLLKSGGVTVESADQHLSESLEHYTVIYESDPATAVAWTQSGANAIQIGFELEAVLP